MATPPEMILAIILNKPEHASHAMAVVPAESYPPDVRPIAEAINRVSVNGGRPDAVSVLDAVQSAGLLDRIGGPARIFHINGLYVTDDNLDYHLEQVSDVNRLRDLRAMIARADQAAQDTEARAVDIASRLEAGAKAILEDVSASTNDVYVPTLAEILAQQDDPYDWVIPGLLERSDRMILTGAEGLGKTVLVRMLAICAAAGAHPFNGSRFAPQRVLFIDCENSARRTRRSMRSMAARADQLSSGAADRMFIENRPEGINLSKQVDEAWFMRVVQHVQPSIIFTGSLYKIQSGNAPNDEEAASRVIAALDRIRTSADAALVIEAHAGKSRDGSGKRDVSPIGSSIWFRWPEFGYGIRRADDFTEESRLVEMIPWRGDRDVRAWPKRLRAGSTWPWQEATDPDAEWRPRYSA